MDKRLKLHDILCEILGSSNVYYQPPASIQMEYPAIKYSRNNIGNTFADDSVYMQTHEYQITVIDEDPDSEIVNFMSTLPMCKFVQHYEADNLNHDVFTLHF